MLALGRSRMRSPSKPTTRLPPTTPIAADHGTDSRKSDDTSITSSEASLELGRSAEDLFACLSRRMSIDW